MDSYPYGLYISENLFLYNLLGNFGLLDRGPSLVAGVESGYKERLSLEDPSCSALYRQHIDVDTV